MSAIKTRFSKSNPCPVCGSGSKGCSATADKPHDGKESGVEGGDRRPVSAARKGGVA